MPNFIINFVAPGSNIRHRTEYETKDIEIEEIIHDICAEVIQGQDRQEHVQDSGAAGVVGGSAPACGRRRPDGMGEVVCGQAYGGRKDPAPCHLSTASSGCPHQEG